MGETETVKVVVRCRPLSTQEIGQGHKSAVHCHNDNNALKLKNPLSSEDPERTFTFDAVFGPDTDQMRVYNVAARPIIENVLKGYNGTIFAYGQTGTGKTHTMTGDLEKAEMRGIIPNSFAHVFDHIAKCGSERTFLVRVSYMEIYNEEVRDLLAKEGQGQNLEIKERTDVGVYVKNLSTVTVSSASHMLKIMEYGNKNRKVGATLMNVESSRSHAIFTVTIESSRDGGHVTQGKLQLVDLAGSERQSKTGASGERLKEAAKINLSLSTLGNVISALVDNKSTHVPYRNSKLTRLLQDSLGGNSKTVMIANVGPASYNYDESLSTLRYANRAKNIQNVARINEDPKDALLRKFQTELATLRAQLEEDEEGGEEAAEGLTTSMDDLRRSRGGAAWEEKMAAMEKELHVKRQELEAKKGIEEETRTKLTEELEEREKELRRAREEHESLRAKLGQIESKLIVGGENLLEKAEYQAQLLSESNEELEHAREQERRLKERLEAKAHEHEKIEEKYSSLQEEADAVTHKLNSIVSEIKMTRAEQSDVESEHQREMEGLLESVRHLKKQLLLNVSIINEFIPDEYLELIEKYVIYDEEKGEWQLKAIAYTGNNIRTEKLPPLPPFDPTEHRPPEALFYSYRKDVGEKTSTAARPSSRAGPRRKSTAQQIKALLK
ncbi:hypothetical protein PFISCL1PPCAC_10806 [Pristionchus fissidentatus]|uniref:Kinesin-like protein n=1 Tax=Pristionchus fissidentatus TaxID=1538716 RepID=A0AAV5VP10_9BILA|nr:hypothetical protein PFISCL1PPCAC_10806 [Pristionchus fissidentatus]